MATTNAGLQQVGVQAVVLDAQQFAQLSKQVEQQIEGMNKASTKLAKEGSSSFEKFSSVGIKSLLALNAVVIGVFAAMQLLGGVNLLQAATSVDQSLAVVQSASQGTQEQLASLKAVVGDLTRTTVANFNDILEASAELARGGIDIQDQIGGALKSVIELSTAAAGELPFDKAARAIASASTIFKIAGEDTSRVANALTVAAQQSAASFNDIIRSFQQVAPIAPLLKISLEDVAAAVGVLGKAGLRGSDAGTSLKQMFIQLLTPTKKAAELMDKYQISLFDANGAVRPLGDLLQDLGDKFGDNAVEAGKLTEAQRDNALATIFGADAIRAAALIAINGTESFFQMRNAMKDGTFTAAQLAAIIQAPLGSQLKILQNNLQATAVDIGTGLLPVIRSLVVELIKAAQAAAPFAKAIGDALNFAFTGAGFQDLQEKLSDLFGSQLAASILGFVTSVQAAVQTIGASISGLITQIQGLSGSDNSVNATTDAFYSMANAVANVAAIVAGTIDALAALVNLAAENTEAFNNFKTVLLSITAGVILASFVGLVLLLGTIASAFSAILIPALAVGVAGGILVGILSNLGNSGDKSSVSLSNMAKAASDASTEVNNLSDDVSNADVTVEPDVDLTSVAEGENALLQSVEDVVNDINSAAVIVPTVDTTQAASDFDHFSSQARLTVTNIANIFNVLSVSLVTIVNSVVGAWTSTFIGFLEFVSVWAHEVATIVANTFNVLGQQVAGLLNGIAAAAASTVGSLRTATNAAQQAIASAPQIDVGGLTDQIDRTTRAAAGLADGAATVSRTVTDAQNRIALLRVELPNRFVPAVAQTARVIRGLGDQLDRTKGSMDGFGGPGGGTDKVKKGAKEAEEAIVGFTEALAKAIRLQEFIDAFGDVGAKAIDALVDAVVSNIDKDGAKAAEALQKFKQLLRTELVPNFRELGEEADAVFAQALIERSDVAIEAAIDVIRRMAEAAKAQGALTVDTFREAFNLGAIANQLGSSGAKLFKDLTKAIVEGGTDAVKAVGAAAADIVSSFVKDLEPEQAREFTSRFMAAIAAAIRDGSPEALREFQDFARQMNFDKEVLKLQNTLQKAIDTAVKTHAEGLAEIARKTVETLDELYDEKTRKEFADAEKQSIKEIGDLQIEVLQSVMGHQRKARQEEKEDRRQALEDERAVADLRDKRDEELADAIKARRKRLQAALKGEAPTRDQQAQGRAIQGNATDPQEDEVKALEKKWAKEDARAAIVLERRRVDLAESRRQATADELFELDLRTQFEEQKKIIEKPFRDFEKAEKEAAFQKQITDLFKTTSAQIVELDKTKNKAIDNANEVYSNALIKLQLEKDLADSVFDGMLEDLRAVPEEIISWHEKLKGQGGTVTVSFAPANTNKTPGPGLLGGLGNPTGLQTVATASGGPNIKGGFGQVVGIVAKKDRGGIIGGAFGQPVPIMAHGGEYVIGLSAIRRMEQAQVPNRSSTVTNNITYQVNSSYSQVQEHGNVMLDMQAMVALTK